MEKQHAGTPCVSRLLVEQTGPDCFEWAIITENEATGFKVCEQRPQLGFVSEAEALRKGQQALESFHYFGQGN
ncbi:hypothetical protein BOTU111921_10580 [Bordetella tumbae]|uniref:hypothetical protein n=1 Tax=Bordetella tumbae TaxID=1649139 RepID=UPI0039EE3D7E